MHYMYPCDLVHMHFFPSNYFECRRRQSCVQPGAIHSLRDCLRCIIAHSNLYFITNYCSHEVVGGQRDTWNGKEEEIYAL